MSENINEQIECCDCNEIHEDLLKIVNDTMPEETELYDLAELFKVFGDSTRIRILFVLFEAEVCVCDLAKVLNMTQSAIDVRFLPQSPDSLSGISLHSLFPDRSCHHCRQTMHHFSG